MAANDIIARLRVQGQQAFSAAMHAAATSLGEVDKKGQGADKTVTGVTDKMSKSVSPMRKAAGRLAAWGGAAAVAYKATHYIHGAIDATEELSKGTMMLSRTTGMDAEQASAWTETVKTRGVDAASFQRGLVAVSKQMESARTGTKASVKMFDALGVSMDAVKKGKTQDVLLQMSDGMAKMQNPAQRAAYAQKLLGRQGQKLLPLFSSGSKAIRGQLDMAKRYGAVVGGKGVQTTKDFAAKQRELKMASDGLKIALGEAVMPLLLSLVQALGSVVRVMQPLLRNSTLVVVVLGALTAAMVALKVATMVSTIMALEFNAAFLLIPLAIIALVAGLIYAYKKVGWFHKAVDAAAHALVAAFHWVVQAVSNVITWFGKLPGAISRVWGSIKRGVSNLVHGFVNFGKHIVTAIVDGIKSAPGAVLDALKSIVPGKLRSVLGKVGLFAHGGVVPTASWNIVGERGPELLQLPGGTRITPLPKPAVAASAIPAGAGGGGTQTTAQFFLDRRLIATAVAEDTADRRARR